MAIYFFIPFIILVLIFSLFLIQKAPDRIERAISALNAKDYETARSLLDLEIKKHNSSTKAHYFMGKCYEKLKRPQDAVKSYREAIQRGEFNSEIKAKDVYRRIADLHYEQDELEKAFEAYLELLKIDPDDLGANSYLGFIALGQKEFSIAKEFLKKSMHLKIEEAKYQLAFMTALFESGETEKAFDIIKNLLEEDPENFDFNLYFIIMSQKENFEEGKEKIEKFIFKTESESVITLLYRFYVYICYHNKSIEDIASFFKKLLTEKKLSEKSKIEISYYRMLSLIKSIIFEEARKIYQEIKNINSSYKDIEALGKFTGFDSEFGLPQEIEKNMNDLFEETVARLLPDNLLFHILGLKTKETIDCAKYFNKTDFKITLKEEYAPLSIDRLFIQYADLPSSKYVRFCEKVIGFHDYLIAKKMKSAEGDGFDFIVKKKTDPDYRVLFAFRRWSDDARISDIFLNNLMNKVNENKTKGAVLISNGSLTDEALKKSSLLKKIKVPDEVELKKIFQINLNNL